MRRSAVGWASSGEGVELVALFFRGLGGLLRLLPGEKSAAEPVGLPQGSAFDHPSVLKWCRLLRPQRRGRNVYSSVVAGHAGVAQGILARHVRRLVSLVDGE